MEVRRADIASLKSGDVAKRRFIIPVGVGVIDSGWVGIGFDEAGALFASNGQQLLEVPRNRLRKTRPSPSIDISEIGSTFVPGAMRFDASNNLWVIPGAFQLLRFAPGDRTASGPPNPGLTLNLLSNFFIVMDLAFDHSGNLWLAGESLPGAGPVIGEVEMISAADLEGSGWNLSFTFADHHFLCFRLWLVPGRPRFRSLRRFMGVRGGIERRMRGGYAVGRIHAEPVEHGWKPHTVDYDQPEQQEHQPGISRSDQVRSHGQMIRLQALHWRLTAGTYKFSAH